MSYGEPDDKKGECNAWLHIYDNHGDNHATMRCHLAEGHGGRHLETFCNGDDDKGPTSHDCVIYWEGDDRIELCHECDQPRTDHAEGCRRKRLQCPRCKGLGRDPDPTHMGWCSQCSGMGTFIPPEQRCLACKGEGYTTDHEPCGTCEGSGERP